MSNISVNKTEFNLMGDNLLQAQNLASTLYTTSKRWGDSIINASVKPNFYQNYLKKNNSNTVSKCINEINATLKLIADLTQNLHDEYINIKGSIDLYESKSLAFNTAMVGNLAYTAGETYQYKTQLTSAEYSTSLESGKWPAGGKLIKNGINVPTSANIREKASGSSNILGVVGPGGNIWYYGSKYNGSTRWDLIKVQDKKGNIVVGYVSGKYVNVTNDIINTFSTDPKTGVVEYSESSQPEGSGAANPNSGTGTSSSNGTTTVSNAVSTGSIYKVFTKTDGEINLWSINSDGTRSTYSLAKIKDGETVKILSSTGIKESDGSVFVKVEYDGKTGYARLSNLSEQISASYFNDQTKIDKIKANFTSIPNTGNDTLPVAKIVNDIKINDDLTLNKDEEIIIVGLEGGKVKIQYEDGKYTLIERKNLLISGTTNKSTQMFSFDNVMMMQTIKKNENFTILGESTDGTKDWIKVQNSSGLQGYILKSDIDIKDTSDLSSSSGNDTGGAADYDDSGSSEETTTDDTASGESSSGSGSGDVGSSAGDSSTAITDTNTSGSAGSTDSNGSSGSTDSNTTVPSGDSNSSSSGNDSTSEAGSAGGTTDNTTGNENTGGTTGGVVPGAGNTSDDSYYNDGTSAGGNNSSVESEEDYPTITFIHTGPDEYEIDIINKDEIANNSGAAGGSGSGGSIDSTPDTPSTPDIGDGSTTIFPDEDIDDAIVPGEGDLGGEITTEGEHTFETIEPEITNPALDEGLYVPESETIITESETDGIVETPVGSTYSESVIEPHGVSAPAEIISGISGTTTFSNAPSASNSATKYSFSSIEDNSFTSVASKTTLGESMATVSMASKADLMPTTSNIASSMPDNIADASVLNTVSAAGAALGIGSVTSKIFNRVDEEEKQVKEESAIGEKFLPVGTIVSVKEVSKKIMIIGFCAMSKEDSAKVYDYIGCFYPEGYMAADKTCMFDHNQIDRVVKLGYVDNEENTFKEKLNKLISSIGTNK